MTADRRPPEGELAAAISNTIVGALARTTGRGPTKAKTTLGENGVFVVLQDTLTTGERTLATSTPTSPSRSSCSNPCARLRTSLGQSRPGASTRGCQTSSNAVMSVRSSASRNVSTETSWPTSVSDRNVLTLRPVACSTMLMKLSAICC